MEEIAKLLTVEALAKELEKLAKSGEDVSLDDFKMDFLRRCLRKHLDEDECFTGDLEEFGCLEEFTEDEEMHEIFETFLEKASPRYLRLAYDSVLGTDLIFRLVPFSPDSGAVIRLFIPDGIDISAKLVSGDLEQGFRRTVRAELEESFEGKMWNPPRTEFSSGVTLVCMEDEYPIEDDAFWDKLLAQAPSAEKD